MEVRELRSLALLIELGSLKSVAERVHLSAVAIHKQLRGLEEELGFPLYERDGRRLQPTRAAQMMLPYITELLAQYDAVAMAAAEWKGVKRGFLRIGAGRSMSSFLVPRLLQRFHTKHPGIDITLETSGGADLINQLSSGYLDLAVVVTQDGIEGPALQIERAWDFEIVLVSARTPLSASDPFAGLSRSPFVAFSRGTAMETLISAYARSLGFQPQVLMRSDNTEALKEMATLGMGVAMLPLWSVDDELARGALHLLRHPRRRLMSQIVLIGRKSGYTPEPVKAFIELARGFRWTKPRLVA